jgi:hypothetical protein
MKATITFLLANAIFFGLMGAISADAAENISSPNTVVSTPAP